MGIIKTMCFYNVLYVTVIVLHAKAHQLSVCPV